MQNSAEEISKMIAIDDAVERLEILHNYNAIMQRNISWVREIMTKHKAKKCIAFLEEKFPRERE